VIAYVNDGHGIELSAEGVADTRSALHPTDRFRAGSNKKTLLATVALQLAAEGKLSLDDTVEHCYSTTGSVLAGMIVNVNPIPKALMGTVLGAARPPRSPTQCTSSTAERPSRPSHLLVLASSQSASDVKPTITPSIQYCERTAVLAWP
jgi:hypothetical protein